MKLKYKHEQEENEELQNLWTNELNFDRSFLLKKSVLEMNKTELKLKKHKTQM